MTGIERRFVADILGRRNQGIIEGGGTGELFFCAELCPQNGARRCVATTDEDEHVS